jgi:putative ABC transport system substrate-binding protein
MKQPGRRSVLGLCLTAAAGLPVRAVAQPAKLLRIGMIVPSRKQPGVRAFEQRLRELGYAEGRNLAIEAVETAGTDGSRLPQAAARLAGAGVDAILAAGPEIALKSAIAATRTVPIVMDAIDYDPLALGYVQSLARPDGNVTGVFLRQIELTPKRLQLLAAAAPGIARIVVFWDRISADQYKATQAAGDVMHLEIEGIEFADRPYDYDKALGGLGEDHRAALLQMTSPAFYIDRDRLAAAALQHRLPSMFAFREWVDAGGLMSYGPSVTGTYRLAADYVDRIAKGARPADLPIEQPTRFELVINHRTAKALGLAVPADLLARADEVLE